MFNSKWLGASQGLVSGSPPGGLYFLKDGYPPGNCRARVLEFLAEPSNAGSPRFCEAWLGAPPWPEGDHPGLAECVA